MIIALPNGKYIADLCIDDKGQYFFFGSFIDAGNAALFKNENDSITVLQRDGRRLVGYKYRNDGYWWRNGVHMDYKDETGGKLIHYEDDFSIIYYPETSEVVCIRYGKEIGPRTKIDSNLLMTASRSYESKDAQCDIMIILID